jgi:hypothetical protein
LETVTAGVPVTDTAPATGTGFAGVLTTRTASGAAPAGVVAKSVRTRLATPTLGDK